MRKLGRRQLKLLRLCGRYQHHTSRDLWEAMHWTERIGETAVSHMLFRLEELGLIDETNTPTLAGRQMLEDRGWYGPGCPDPRWFRGPRF